jgi:hypothetical protein
MYLSLGEILPHYQKCITNLFVKASYTNAISSRHALLSARQYDLLGIARAEPP